MPSSDLTNKYAFKSYIILKQLWKLDSSWNAQNDERVKLFLKELKQNKMLKTILGAKLNMKRK